MTREEIKNLILRRAYAGVFEEGIEDVFNLHKYAEENGIDNDEAWKAYQELADAGLIRTAGLGGFIRSTAAGLIYAEWHELAEEVLIRKQNIIRNKLLITLADIKDRSPHGTLVDWEVLIREAGVSKSEFLANDELLRHLGLIKKVHVREYEITSDGMDKVYDYLRRKRRLEDFERLEKLEGVTEQQRGHKLEDLLADTAEWEKWEVKRRVRAQGQELDIIMHVGTHYFLSSCKWEAEPIQPKEVELLESRVRSRATTNGGILFSMSGFTDNCILEMRLKISSALIIPFGPKDIRRIMSNEIIMTDLLDEKIGHIMNHRIFLIDGDTK